MNQPYPDPVVLGLLAACPSHGYQLLEAFHAPDQLGRVWTMSTSQLYAVLKRLEQQGLIAGREIASPDAPPRTEYGLTDAGHDCLLRWLNDRQPSASVRRVRVEFLSRLYLARLLNQPTAPIVRYQKVACQHQRHLLVDQRDATPPGIGFLALEFMITQLEGILQWIDRCEMVDAHGEEKR
jgi:DNA-binding PadR family transcriptional regulator